MTLRKYQSSDCTLLAELFYSTVHTVNAKDYTKQQLNAWATGKVDIKAWDKSFSAHHTVVAEENGIIIGFGDMDDTGYFDRLYVHKDYQSKGVATAIANELEELAKLNGNESFTTHASITAVPFFKKRGYTVLNKNTVERDGVEMTNYIMIKQLVK